jgi:hypothetical protein
MNPNTFRWERITLDGDIEQGLLWAGVRSYPGRFHSESAHDYLPASFVAEHPDYRMETRQAWVHFENQWQLSTIWGDATYSSNRMDFLGKHPFIEEPTHVEVGVIVPEYENEHGSGLWGDPLGYVSVPEYHRLTDLVTMLPFKIDMPEGEWETAEGFCDFLITAGLARTL